MTQPETRIDEVIDGIYRIASWSPDYGSRSTSSCSTTSGPR